jgi:hypothetical protein
VRYVVPAAIGPKLARNRELDDLGRFAKVMQDPKLICLRAKCCAQRAKTATPPAKTTVAHRRTGWTQASRRAM